MPFLSYGVTEPVRGRVRLMRVLPQLSLGLVRTPSAGGTGMEFTLPFRTVRRNLVVAATASGRSAAAWWRVLASDDAGLGEPGRRERRWLARTRPATHRCAGLCRLVSFRALSQRKPANPASQAAHKGEQCATGTSTTITVNM